MTERQAIHQLKQGDEGAFRYIYERHYLILCGFANQLLGDPAWAEEIVDDTIFYLWEHREDVEITHSLRAYLMKAVRNRCLNAIHSLPNREEIRLSAFAEDVEFFDSIFIDDAHPLGHLLEKELENELLSRIEELPPECRAVFKKSRFEGKKYEEISAELGISVNTVKYHIKNALAFLQEKLKAYMKLLALCFFPWN